MIVSFDGLRRNATDRMNKLYDVIEDILENEDICQDNREQIIDMFNATAACIDTFNCLYDDDIEDDMNDLSELLSIYRLEQKDIE
jgi:hypothetical protein